MKNYHILHTSSLLLRLTSNHVLSFCNLIHAAKQEKHIILMFGMKPFTTSSWWTSMHGTRVISQWKNMYHANFLLIFILTIKANEMIASNFSGKKKQTNKARDTENNSKQNYRRGCAVTVVVSRCDLKKIVRHIRSLRMFSYTVQAQHSVITNTPSLYWILSVWQDRSLTTTDCFINVETLNPI